MPKQLMLLFAILLTSCERNSQSITQPSTSNRTPGQENLNNFTITKVTATDFYHAKNSFVDRTLYDTATFRKTNGEIKLPIDKNRNPFVIFRDTLATTDDTEARQYYYAGQFDKIGFYIVDGNFWEHSECYLIDQRTGKQTTTWNTPIISPSDKFIANLSMTYGLEGIPNGLQVWRIDRQQNNQGETIFLSKHIELDQEIWVPVELVWEKDNSILLKVTAVEKYLNESGQPNETDFYYLRLSIQ